MIVPPRVAQDASATTTIILGDGLDEDVVSAQVRHFDSRAHVGQREVERLFGRGRSHGQGPLPTLLRAALERRARGERIGVVLLARADDQARNGDHGGVRFAPPLDTLAGQCSVVACQDGHVPWDGLRAAIAEQAGLDPGSEATRLRVLVVGCHTEGRVLALALVMRLLFRCEEIAISHHLVGSAVPEAHLAVLRHTLPGLGVRVLLDLDDVARFAHLQPRDLHDGAAGPCRIEPEEVRTQLSAEQREIVERLCMHWTRARLRALKGGFSGSLLLMAEGWKGEARTEPLVLKIDAYRQMRRELAGYYMVKDFLGKHVPTFGHPVSAGDWVGVGMELAAKEGTPETLQETFQRAHDEDAARHFARRLDKTLEMLAARLLSNTREVDWVVPYRDFGLHTEDQQRWLMENAVFIDRYLQEAGVVDGRIDPQEVLPLFALISSNQNGLESEVCLAHGDLNYANVICDQSDGIWLIDWTHCARMPLELDFAKLENDAKFVMDNALELEDLQRLRRLEGFLAQNKDLPALEALPAELAFVKWDLRLRKLYGTVRRVRAACFALKAGSDWTVYRIALLRYAAHTLSFDARRGRGECDLVQLASALNSVRELCYELFADPFHMQIRTERPDDYPKRQRITVDEAPWSRACPQYAPPYYVAPAVLAGHGAGGWADPEDVAAIRAELAARPAEHRDEQGRPLNPAGRTGIAGRGLLGLWGPNVSLAAVLVRPAVDGGALELVLGQRTGETHLELPKGFVLPGESAEAGFLRILRTETGVEPRAPGEVVVEESTFDPRHTDHAWVETRVHLWFDVQDEFPDLLAAGGDFETLNWWPLVAETINRLPSGQAGLVRACVQSLAATGSLGQNDAHAVLAGSG
ncbi:MAG: NUDIX domain-containing protein [Planctomycetota bacterium]|nr:NUDIX domain-containing protein [Planctomycetota bacterium]